VSGEPVRVAVAVVTFRRPADLAELLPRLLAQVAGPLSDEPGVRARVLVVDNDVVDGAGSAWPIVEPHGGAVQYELEPTPGIAAARNRALTASLAAGDDLLVFIDDDERPVADWPVGVWPPRPNRSSTPITLTRPTRWSPARTVPRSRITGLTPPGSSLASCSRKNRPPTSACSVPASWRSARSRKLPRSESPTSRAPARTAAPTAAPSPTAR